MKKTALALTIGSLLFSSCDSFMEVTPKGSLIPETTKDFYDMMGDPVYASGAFPLADICCDNVEILPESVNGLLQQSSGKAYYFYDNFYNETDDDSGWSGSYSTIYNCNIVMQYIPDSKEGTQAEKDMAMAEARVNRAYYFWWLTSIYGKAYDKATADTDLGVPLMLIPDLEAKPERATQAAVHAQILQDLEGAAKFLPLESDNKYRVVRGSAHAVLARVYLYMGEYEKAAKEAEEALKINKNLLDYRTFKFKNEKKHSSGVTNKPEFLRSPEVLFYRGLNGGNTNVSFGLSPELEQLYEQFPGDLRMKFNYSPQMRNGDPVEDGLRRCLFNIDHTVGVPEMMLIVAENYARKGDSKALEVLNEMRKTRFLEADYKPLTANGKEELLKVVLEERRRELHMNGLRWFDMKRLAKEGLYTRTLVRTVQGVEHKLEPNSNRYVFPFSPALMAISPKLEQNPR